MYIDHRWQYTYLSKLKIFFLIYLFIKTNANAYEEYIVKPNDTLSKIVQDKFPDDRLYGKNGKILKILSLNPQIKNANLILPQQSLILNENGSTTADTHTSADSFNTTSVDRFISSEKPIKPWSLAVIYGAKYVSISQLGTIDKGKVGVIFLDNLHLSSELAFEDIKYESGLASYKFKYENEINSTSRSMNSLYLEASYKSLIGGFYFEENPFFKNNNGNIEMLKMSSYAIAVGIGQDYQLPYQLHTFIKLKGLMKYSLSSASSRTDIKISSKNSLGALGKFEISRRFSSSDDYSLYLSWLTQVDYKKNKISIESDSTEQKGELEMLDLSSGLGLLLNF